MKKAQVLQGSAERRPLVLSWVKAFAGFADSFFMKRTAMLVGSSLVVLCILFPIVWAIVRVFAQDFPALGFAAGGLSFAISLALTAYVIRDVMTERVQDNTSEEPAGSERA